MEILVSVNPGSKKIQVKKEGEDILTNRPIYKIHLTAKPINNEANKQLIEVVADFFKVKKRCVNLVKGNTSKLKLIKIDC